MSKTKLISPSVPKRYQTHEIDALRINAVSAGHTQVGIYVGDKLLFSKNSQHIAVGDKQSDREGTAQNVFDGQTYAHYPWRFAGIT